MAALSPADQATLRALRRTDVELAVADLKSHLTGARWIANNNRYKTDTVRLLERDDPLQPRRQRDLVDYVAASAILHANDGWSYLGCALSVLLQGDAHRALHLAYYAELRAALSLLASEGLGVFNGRHYVLKGGGQAAKLDHRRGTHAATWDILEFWSGEPSSGALFTNLIRPEGRTLDDWFQPHGGGGPLAAQAQSWFKLWGMDLAITHKDQFARNESSYAPDGLNSFWAIPAAESLSFVTSLWTSLKPRPTSSFAEIDRHILRMSLESLFKGRAGKPARPHDPAYQTLVSMTVNRQGFTGRAAQLWFDFLTRKADPDDPIIFSASARANAKKSVDVFGVLSRAVLLLRLATGSARDLLERAGLTAADLDFWVQDIGVSRGLWEPGEPAPDLRDLWADIADALGDLSEQAPPTSVKGFLLSSRDTLPILSSSERVGLWSLCA